MFCPGFNEAEDSLLAMVKPGPTVAAAVSVKIGVVKSFEVKEAVLGITVPETGPEAPESTLTSIQTSPVVWVVALPRDQVTPLPGPDPETAPLSVPGGPVETKVVSGG